MSIVKNIDKLGGIDEKKLKLIQAELQLMLSSIKALNDLAELSFPAGTDVNEYKRKVLGFVGSLHKAANDAMTAMILGNAQERPKSGWEGLVLGVFENMSIPLEIAEDCYGVSKPITDPVDRMKCYTKVAKTVNEQTIRTVFYTMGAVKQYRTLSSINDSVVTQRVLEEFLIAGSDNIKMVFDKYGVAYPDGKNAYLDSIRFGVLIKKIGDGNFNYTGVPDYKEWFSSLVYSVFVGNPYSVANVRMSVVHYYNRIQNEAFIDETPLMYLYVSAPTENREVTVTAEFDIANAEKFKYGKLVCYADDSIGGFSLENPWSSELWNISPVSFKMNYSGGGHSKIVCKLYDSRNIYIGGKSVALVVSDNDGLPDEWEVQYGLDPGDPADAYLDKDGDGLSNIDEFKHKTDPTKQDTDGDDFNDKQEVDANTDPLDKNKYPITMSAPQNLKATPGDGKVTLSWDAVTNAAGYTVCHATQSIANFDNCASYANGALEDTNGTGLILSGLTNGTIYHFRVIAGDANGNKSPASDEREATPSASTSTSTTSCSKPVKSILFKESFDGASIDTTKWDVDQTGGSAILLDGKLSVLGNGSYRFPVVQTKTNPFPAMGNFSFYCKAEYTHIGPSGTGPCTAVEKMLTPNGSATGTYDGGNALSLWLNGMSPHSPTLYVGGFNGTNKIFQASSPFDGQSHEYEFCVIGSQVTGYRDGVKVGEGTLPANWVRPTKIFIGNPVLSVDTDWSTFDTDAIEVRELEGSTDNSDWILNPTTGHYYKALDNCGNWEQCETAAQALGAHLVSIGDVDENQWILEKFGSSANDLWIGFTDKEQEGFWKWLDGTPSNYVNWWPTEPTNTCVTQSVCVGESYAAMRTFGNGIGLAGEWWDADFHDPANAGVNIKSAIIERTTAPTGNANPFTVQAADETGTAFTVPAGKTQCTFNATGTWAESWGGYDADGRAGFYHSQAILPSRQVGALVIKRSDNTYEVVGKNAVKSFASGDVVRFVFNDIPGSYVDNSGSQSVSWLCQ